MDMAGRLLPRCEPVGQPELRRRGHRPVAPGPGRSGPGTAGRLSVRSGPPDSSPTLPSDGRSIAHAHGGARASRRRSARDRRDPGPLRRGRRAHGPGDLHQRRAGRCARRHQAGRPGTRRGGGRPPPAPRARGQLPRPRHLGPRAAGVSRLGHGGLGPERRARLFLDDAGRRGRPPAGRAHAALPAPGRRDVRRERLLRAPRSHSGQPHHAGGHSGMRHSREAVLHRRAALGASPPWARCWPRPASRARSK